MSDPIPLEPTQARLLFPELLGRLLTYAATNAGVAIQIDHADDLTATLRGYRLVYGSFEYLTDHMAVEYLILGNFWRQLHHACRWGGDDVPPNPGRFALDA